MTPKSLGVATSPRPKWYSHTRLTMTRAVSGLSGPAGASSARARGRRQWAGGGGTALLWPFERLEDGQQAVIIRLAEGLELVVVAAGAAQGQAQEGGRRHAQHVVELVVAVDVGVG